MNRGRIKIEIDVFSLQMTTTCEYWTRDERKRAKERLSLISLKKKSQSLSTFYRQGINYLGRAPVHDE